MKKFLCVALLAALIAGCTTKAAARRQAHQAFLAGQRAAAAQPEAARTQTPVIEFVGAVRYPTLDWSPEMTLGTAFLVAEYYGPEPRDFLIHRGGNVFHIAPQSLLEGEDVQLEPGDVIEIR